MPVDKSSNFAMILIFRMADELQPYRQPMVTATGLLLGFAFNVGGRWASHAFSTERVAEIFVAVGVCTAAPLFIIVIYRILNQRYDPDKAKSYYRRTLFLLVTGAAIFYFSIVAIMIESLILNSK